MAEQDVPGFERFAVAVLRLVAPQVRRFPNGFGRALSALAFYLSPVKEIVVIGEKGNALEREIFRNYLPNKVVVLAENGENADFIPLLQERGMLGGKATAYICENFTCQKPVTEIEDLKQQIA